MASAALAELYGMDTDQIEYAAEVAMEHHLGLTCDPVMGLFRCSCIERNAVAAMRAINAVSLANFFDIHKKDIVRSDSRDDVSDGQRSFKNIPRDERGRTGQAL